MKISDFIANLINYYYPISDFVKAAFILDCKNKGFSESDYDKLYYWITHNFSRKWKTTPDIAIIEEAEKAINEFAEKHGTKKDYLDYSCKYSTCKQIIDKYSISEPEKDYSKEMEATFEKLKKKFGNRVSEVAE